MLSGCRPAPLGAHRPGARRPGAAAPARFGAAARRSAPRPAAPLPPRSVEVRAAEREQEQPPPPAPPASVGGAVRVQATLRADDALSAEVHLPAGALAGGGVATLSLHRDAGGRATLVLRGPGGAAGGSPSVVVAAPAQPPTPADSSDQAPALPPASTGAAGPGIEAAAPAGGARAGVPEAEATHAFYGGCLHPVRRDAEGQLAIIIEIDSDSWEEIPVGAAAAVGAARLVALPPIGGGEAQGGDGKEAPNGSAAAGAVQAAYEARAAQLCALGAVVEGARFCSPAEPDHDAYLIPVFEGGAHKHVLLPGGLVCPVFEDEDGDQLIAPPSNITFAPDDKEDEDEDEDEVKRTYLHDLVESTPFYYFYLA
jgi:hypothetical protein